MSSFEQKTNFLYFTTRPTKCAHRLVNTQYIQRCAGESKLTSEICYTMTATNSHSSSILSQIPSLHMFQGSKKTLSTNTFKAPSLQGKSDCITPFLKLLPRDCKRER